MDSQNCDFTYGVTDVKVEEDCEKFEYEEQENILSKHSFLESPEGSTVISLFREFLEYIGLKLTISAYEAEVESFYQYSGRTELAHNLKLDPDQEGPLIVQVLSESKVCRPKLAASEVASICSSTDEVVEEPTSDCEDIVINTEDLDEDNKDLDFVKVITVDSDTPTSSWRLLPTISRTNTRSLKRTKLDDNSGQSDNGRQQDNGNNTIVQNQILLSPGVYEVGNDNALTRKHHRGSGCEYQLDFKNESSSDESVTLPSRQKKRCKDQPHQQQVNQYVPVKPSQSPTESMSSMSFSEPELPISTPNSSPSNDDSIWVRVHPPERPRNINKKFRVRDPGPRHIEGCSRPIDFFMLFMSNDVWDLMVQATNGFAHMHMDLLRATGRLRPASRMHEWVDVTVEEMKRFLALLLNMGLTRRAEVEHYWSTLPNLFIPSFSQIMTLRRFQQIFAMFHVSNRVSLPRSHPVYDPWANMRDFLDHMNVSFKKFFVPKQEICIDESTICVKNRCAFIHYLVNKRHSKLGVKKFELCDSKTGYVLQSTLHSGHDFWQNGDNLFPEKVVHELMSKAGLYHKGYHLFTNSLYTKVSLANFLRERETYLTGTISESRKSISQLFEETETDVGESLYFRNGKVLAVKYKELPTFKSIVLISTASHAEDQRAVSCVEEYPNSSRVEGVKPVVISSYNQHMGSVNSHKDKSIHNVTCRRQTKTYWKKIVYNFIDMALLNSYILYSYHSKKPMTKWLYINTIVNSLLPIPAKALISEVGRLANPSVPAPVDHRLATLPGRNNRICVVCKKKCSIWCPPCNVGVHVKCVSQMQHFLRGEARGGSRRVKQEEDEESDSMS